VKGGAGRKTGERATFVYPAPKSKGKGKEGGGGTQCCGPFKTAEGKRKKKNSSCINHLVYK